MKLFALIYPLVAALAFAQTSAGSRYPMTEATIASFLRTNGFSVTLSQVHLPMVVTAITPEPQLEITAIQRVNKAEVRLELHCRGIGECLPFDALVDVGNMNPFVELDTKSRLHSSAAEAGSGSETGEKAAYARVVDRTAARVRVGASVVLLVEDGQMQIHLPAIAMDSGSAGDMVRVCTLNRKKVFRAQVVDSEVVKEVIE